MKNYTSSDGLPSNNVYRVLEDNKGFLWVTTDAGVARFDGKNFQIFTTVQGLPDNDIIYLDKEKDGTIWVSGIKQMPAYFDNIQNKFIIPLTSEEQKWFENTTGAALRMLKSGGTYYYNRNKFILFKNRKIEKFGNADKKWRKSIIEEFEDGTTLYFGGNYKEKDTFISYGFYHYKNNEIRDSLVIVRGNRHLMRGAQISEERVYLWKDKADECVVLSDIKVSPIRFKRDTIRLPEPTLSIVFSEKSVYFQGVSGAGYVYDKKTFELKHILKGDFLPNGYGEDSKGNFYATSVDKGLMQYKNQKVKPLAMPDDFTHTNFLSIAKKNNTIFAGNYYGEVAEFNSGKFKLHQTNKIVTAKIRKVIATDNDVYTFSEQGIYRNYNHKIILPRGNSSIL